MSVMSRRLRVVPLLAAVCFTSSVGVSRAGAQETAASGDTLARQVSSAPISLARGLSAARARGTPISAKYEMEEGKPQLSIYTAKDNRFWEVIVDHRTGRIAKAEEIKQGDDLTAAKAQSDAMAKGKRSLSAAITRALRENRGSHVVSVVPSVEAGHPVATVRLVNGRTFKTVSEPLN